MLIRSLALLLLLTQAERALAAERTVTSPDGGVSVTVSDAKGARWSARYRGVQLFTPADLGLDLRTKPGPDVGTKLGEALVIVGSSTREVADRFDRVAGKSARVEARGRAMLVDFREPGAAGRRLSVEVRAYDDGIAFRYILPEQDNLVAPDIANELTTFGFARDHRCWSLNLGAFGTNHEGEYESVSSASMRDHNLLDAPLLCDAGGAAFAITEANLKNWSAMNLAGRGDGLPGLSVRLTPSLDNRRIAVRTSAGGPVVSPWRVVMLAPSAGKLIENDLVAALSDAPAVSDTSWIKPGKAAWDWWNGSVVKGVAKPGMNAATMTRFIDFAAAQGFEYMLIDEGWHAGAGGGGLVYPGADVTRPLPEMELPRLVAHAASKNVGLWLWVNWQALDARMEEALALYARLGIKGIKVDFMDRDDQAMVAWYHKLLQATARHRLMVNLHGAYHPTGLSRTYPHLLTQEGVLGAEYNKWSHRVTAAHNVTLPYTRMLTGPMDYTAGGFRNVTPATFAPRDKLPMVQTTRAHGLAMYVVYESALGVVSDSPDTYAASPEGLDLLRAVPVTWDETRFLSGTPGSHVVIARRRGREWWLGAMTNEQARDVEVPLDFLAAPATADIAEDGSAPTALRRSTRPVRPGDKLVLKLAASGGAVVRFR